MLGESSWPDVCDFRGPASMIDEDLLGDHRFGR